MLGTLDTGDRHTEEPDRVSAAARHPSTASSLLAIRELLGLDIAFVGEHTDEEQILICLRGDGRSFGFEEGMRMPLAETYCTRVLAGEMPALILDTRADSVARALPITEAAGIGAFISVPLRRSDGSLYGTLCAASHAPKLGLAPRDVNLLGVFAQLMCDEIERVDSERARRRREVAAVSIDALLAAVGARDAYIRRHTQAVVGLARRVGVAYGLSHAEFDDVADVALLHDIGKVAVPDAVLLKAGPLDAEECLVMREHPVIGARILAAMPGLAHLARAVRAAHERWDGRGYPDGVKGEAIPVASRIVLACDAYDAMTSDRPYRAARTPDAAATELRRHAGDQFDPRAVHELLADQGL